MKKASEYRKHAAECRSLAAAMAESSHREQLLKMAETWDQMAEERERIVRMNQAPSSPPMRMSL